MPPPATNAAAQVDSTRLRLTFLTLLVVSLFVLLFARLWFLQVMAGERYVDLAQGNAVRSVSVTAPRGKILDRDGEALVRNRFALAVAVQPSEMGDRRDEVLAEVADLLGLSLQEVQSRIDASRVSALKPKPVALDVPTDIAFYLHENRSTMFPGVYAETIPVREYPHGELAAHVVGYLGEISEEELTQERYADYRLGDLIGWAGLERSYEHVLRGAEGLRRYEVNRLGDILTELPDVRPVPGADVKTTIDLEAQQVVEESLREGIERAQTVRDSAGRAGGYFQAPAGAAVVLDPRDGGVVAMASYPTYDPREFVGGVSTRYWNRLQSKRNHFPLINRAVQSSYPPGSVFKVVSAAAALENGYMSPTSTLPCPAAWYWNEQRFRNWASYDMGSMDMSQALEDSCDTVFYELARDMWLDEQASGAKREYLADTAKAWGFGTPTGVDIPSERGGVVPGRKWKREFHAANKDAYCTQARQADADSYAEALFTDLCERGDVWRGGDAVNMSIGQGDLQTTPLQVANAYAAIANGGTLFKPHVGAEIVEPDGTARKLEPEVLGELPVSRRHLDVIREGLVRVASQGTASATFGGFEVPVAGKTGTAEFKPKQPIAWFASYAPVDDPRYVVVVMIEEGGGGSLNAAPIARRIYEGLFDLGETEITPGQVTD